MPSVRQYHAPNDSGGMLFDPIPHQIPDDVVFNRRIFSALSSQRQQSRSELAQVSSFGAIPLDPKGIWLMGGHQPELFHPGVWLKNFYLAGLAKRVDGTAINLIVDTDTVKHPILKIPLRGDSPEFTQLAEVSLDGGEEESIWAQRAIHNRRTLVNLDQRIAPLIGEWSWRPAIMELWENGKLEPILERSHSNLGLFHVELRRSLEREWGIQTVEIPVSQLSQTSAFREFAKGIVDDLPQFVQVYNQGITNYRQKRGLQSRTHPATLLAQQGETYETPFWQGIPKPPYRGKWFAKQGDPLPQALYPRAFTLTLFVRLFLADVFLHGLGGGLYDEVTDEIIHEFYHLDPPRYAVATGTLRLPFEYYPAPSRNRSQLLAELRKLDWNPEEFVQTPLSIEKWKLREQAITATQNRKPIARRIRVVNSELRDTLCELRQAKLEEIAAFDSWTQANALLRNRDYSWVLHPLETLKAFGEGAFRKGISE